MASGDILYKDLWDNIAPLSATSYWIMHVLFGKSQLAYQIVALILVLIQSVQFNSILIRNNAYNESSYIPAALYVIVGSIFFDFMTLSPQLIALTFILPALNNTFQHIEFRGKARFTNN